MKTAEEARKIQRERTSRELQEELDKIEISLDVEIGGDSDTLYHTPPLHLMDRVKEALVKYDYDVQVIDNIDGKYLRISW